MPETLTHSTAAIVRLRPVNPVDAQIGMRLRTLRLERQMSVQQLGDACYLTEAQIAKYETGTMRIGAARLSVLAQVLACTSHSRADLDVV